LRLQPEILVGRAIKIPANSPHPLAPCSAAGCPTGNVRFADTAVDGLSASRVQIGLMRRARLVAPAGARPVPRDLRIRVRRTGPSRSRALPWQRA